MFNQCKNGHTDEIFDGYCDNCGADLVMDDIEYPGSASAFSSIISVLKAFFEKIAELFKGLFN